jgi:hypothetical protein
MSRSVRDRRKGDELVTLRELDEELKDLRSSVKGDVSAAVRSEVENSLKLYRVAAFAFAAGFAVFLTAGLVTRGQLFESMMKAIYTPENIYKDLQPEVTSTVWSTVTSGTAQDYEKFISRNEFYEALRAYHTDLVKTFLLPTRERTVRAREVLQAGKVPLDATVLMAGKQYNGKPTSRCFKQFVDSDSQAIIVIPESADPAEFGWFDCAFGWPKLNLALKVGDKEVDDLQLVGVRRNGGTERLQVLLTQEAAKRLQLSGWEEYKAHAFGKVRVASAE